MIVGIHKDPYNKFCSFLKRYEDILTKNKIETIRLEASQADFFYIVKTLDLFIFRWRHYDTDKQMALAILPIVEKDMGIRCFPDMATSWHFDDKIRQYYLLKCHGFPIIESRVFWDKQSALEWIETAIFPVVFKLKGGAGSLNVVLVSKKSEAESLISQMFSSGIKSLEIPKVGSIKRSKTKLKYRAQDMVIAMAKRIKGEDTSDYWQIDKNYVLFQDFLPNNEFDTRITVIGNRAFGFRRYNRANDFRASGSGLCDYDIAKVDLRCVQIAFNVSKKLRFQSMAYDFLNDENNEPQIAEISYTYVDKAIYTCPGYWDEDLRWYEGNFWPQYCQLVDLLNMPDLKQS